ncbi:MAG: hypothetical protein V1672_02915 [Candidatus Diapherotrites archaeon]
MTEFKFGHKWGDHNTMELIRNGKSIGYISWTEKKSWLSGKKTWNVMWLKGPRRSSIEMIVKLLSLAKDQKIDYIKPFSAGDEVKALMKSLEKKKLIKIAPFRGIVVNSIKLDMMLSPNKKRRPNSRKSIPPKVHVTPHNPHNIDPVLGRRIH